MRRLVLGLRDYADELACFALGSLGGLVLAVSAEGGLRIAGVALGGVSAGALLMGFRVAVEDARRRDGR